MLIKLGLVEQRHQAVLEVLAGQTVTAVARRYGVARQTLHAWLRAYGDRGLAGLIDRSCRPASCPHQMPPPVEARVIELRHGHPGWGPRSIGHRLSQEGVSPLPGRSSIYRCLLRHGLIEPVPRRRRRGEYRRWERSRAMELWQLDVMGLKLADGREVKLISGIDDHSRFCVSAMLVPRATARPVCEALITAMGRYGIPEQVLTDNGKVFTARFSKGSGEVLFDRLCRENGIRHLLTAPRSPTTTGKVERFHKTIRAELLAGRSFASLEEVQEALDAWVSYYNAERPHQGIGMVAPAKRFGLAAAEPLAPIGLLGQDEEPPARAAAPALTRCVHADGKINLGGHAYHVGVWLAGQTVAISLTENGLVEIIHRGVLIAAHARRHPPAPERALSRRSARPRPPSSGVPVLRLVDRSGGISFAGSNYRVGNGHRLKQVEVRVVGDTVQISLGGKIIRTHQARHDRSKEHGAFATPRGRPRRSNSASKSVTKVPEPECQTGTGT